MIWRFTLIDRNNVKTVFDEPAGWDDNKIEIRRDLESHGIVFTNNASTFEYEGIAMKKIRAEYEADGIAAILYLTIEEDCGSGFEEFYHGKFDFNRYSRRNGDLCFVKCEADNGDETMQIRNRINQKVDLDFLVAFDQSTPLAPYAKLPFSITLPSKAIFIQDRHINETNSSDHFLGVVEVPPDSLHSSSEFGMVSIGLNKLVAAEIGDYFFSPTPTYTRSAGGNGNLYGTATPAIPYSFISDVNYLWPNYISPTLNYNEGSANFGDLSGPCPISFRLKGTINCLISRTGHFRSFLLRKHPNSTGEHASDYDFIDVQDVHLALMNQGDSTGFDVSFNGSITLGKDDQLFLFIANYHIKSYAQIASGGDAFSITFDTDSFFWMKNLSKTKATDAKVFMVNETLSRVVESITNDRVRAFSEFYGRTDSQPYALPADGCGSLKAVTNGIRIRRQENKIVGQTSVFSMSLKDMFEGLNPIDNIGMGLEPDPNRPGYNRMRFERWDFFYKNTTTFSCIGVAEINLQHSDKDVFSTVQIGYQKWEAEEYTGLDEHITKKIFRTVFDTIKNDFIKLSTLIASPYAWEITRRKGNLDSKDWRYDKEAFVLCLTKSPAFHVVFSATGNSMIITYSGSSAPFSVPNITIAGSASNNGPRVINVITFNDDNIVIEFAGGVTNNETADGVLFPGIVFATPVVETGKISSPQNIIDPPSTYNFRIRPISNLMRWACRIFESYRTFGAGNQIIFTDGDANNFAKGQLSDPTCRPENQPIAENDTVSPAIFADQNFATPFRRDERVIYDFPLNSRDYKIIKAAPYGLIHFEGNNGEIGDGWIDNIVYKPEDGIATFTLIPKR